MPRRPSASGRSGILIGLAFNQKPTRRARGTADDLYAEWDDAATISAVEAALAAIAPVARLPATDDFPARLRRTRPTIVFNIAEGLSGPNREAHVPAFCEFWRVPYTGSDPLTLSLCLDKRRAKEVLAYHGVPTAAFRVVHGAAELNGTPGLPAIVKPLHEGSSKGIPQTALCRSRREVGTAVATVVATYRQPALVERWLPGREFTCAILGNGGGTRILPIIEVDFAALPAGAAPLYSYEAKWVWDTPARPLAIFRCPAPVSPELARKVERTALGAYRALGCRDWARIDLRCDARGVPHVLEVNPLPGVLPDPAMNSCFPKAARAAGLDYAAMIQAVLRAAAARHEIAL